MATQLTSQERDRLGRLWALGFTKSEVAKHLGRSPSTIGRELNRNRSGRLYLSGEAQRKACQRRRDRPLQRQLDRPETNQFVRRGLASGWSPAQIAGRLRHLHSDQPEWAVSATSIYRWIQRQGEQRAHWQQFLRRRGKRPARRRATDPAREQAALAHRPAEINQRQRLGDFEGDLVLGQPGTGGLLTLVDRRSRYTLLAKVRNKQARHVHGRVQKVLKPLAPEQRRSVTFDHGTEFTRCGLLEKHLGVALYLAQPGCPYQRGTNENTNGLLRQTFPKGSDFRQVSHHAVEQAQDLLNHRPRACLGYQTPHEVFREQAPLPICDSDG
jgi:IS30 family transposase